MIGLGVVSQLIGIGIGIGIELTKLLADREATLSEHRHQDHITIERCCCFLLSSTDNASHT
jgi:hypothetical protein